MLRYLGYFLFAVAAVSASGNGSGENEPPINVEDFKAELMNLQGNAAAAAGRIDEVLSHAIAGQADQTGAAWEGFEENFISMMQEVGEAFDAEEKRMVKVIERFWDRPGNFVETRACNSVVNLAKNKDQAHDFNQVVVALIEDMGCFREEFKSAEQIPTQWMTPGMFAEADAIQVIGGVFEKMFYIKHSGEAFGEAIRALHEEAQPKVDRRTLEKLLRMVKNLSKK